MFFSYISQILHQWLKKDLLLIDKIKKDIKKHKIPNEKSMVSPIVTISIGLITINTDIDTDEKEIIKRYFNL